MFGLDKGLSLIGIELIANLGYNSVTGVMGFVSNICIGGTALAVATTIKRQQGAEGHDRFVRRHGAVRRYRANLLRRVAVTAESADRHGHWCSFRWFSRRYFRIENVRSGRLSGYLTLLFFVDQNGGLYYVWIAILVAAIATIVSFLATKIISARI